MAGHSKLQPANLSQNNGILNLQHSPAIFHTRGPRDSAHARNNSYQRNVNGSNAAVHVNCISSGSSNGHVQHGQHVNTNSSNSLKSRVLQRLRSLRNLFRLKKRNNSHDNNKSNKSSRQKYKKHNTSKRTTSIQLEDALDTNLYCMNDSLSNCVLRNASQRRSSANNQSRTLNEKKDYLHRASNLQCRTTTEALHLADDDHVAESGNKLLKCVKKNLFKTNDNKEVSTSSEKSRDELEDLLKGLKFSYDESGYDTDRTRGDANFFYSDKPIEKSRSFSITSKNYQSGDSSGHNINDTTQHDSTTSTIIASGSHTDKLSSSACESVDEINRTLEASVNTDATWMSEADTGSCDSEKFDAFINSRINLGVVDNSVEKQAKLFCHHHNLSRSTVDLTEICSKNIDDCDGYGGETHLEKFKNRSLPSLDEPTSSLIYRVKLQHLQDSIKPEVKSRSAKSAHCSVLSLLDDNILLNKDSPLATKINPNTSIHNIVYSSPKRSHCKMEFENDVLIKKAKRPRTAFRVPNPISKLLADRKLKIIKLFIRQPGNLGISVERQEAAKPFFIVTKIDPKGEAAKSKQICIGDEIVQICGRRLRGMSIVEARNALKNCVGLIELQIAREQKLVTKDESTDMSTEMEVTETEPMEGFTVNDSSEPSNKTKQMSIGRKKFNMDPKKGIEYLVEHNLLSLTPEDISQFLYKGEGLNKTGIGDYLGDRHDFNERVLRAFVELHDLTDLSLIQALRQFLWSFRLPGEAQKIDRMMECFAQRYCQLNPNIFINADTCYVLSYAIIMLNTLLHNPSVKDKPSIEQFISMNRGINNGGDLPRELLVSLYENIKTEPFKIPDDDENDLMQTFFNPDKEGWLWKQGRRYKCWKRRWFILNDNCLYYFVHNADKKLRGIIPLENIQVREVHDRHKPHCFKLSAPGSEFIKACKTDRKGNVVQGKHAVYRMSAATNEEKDKWIKCIRQSISHNPFHDMLTPRKTRLRKNISIRKVE